MKVAVVGGGISGMLSTRLLTAEYDAHLFEAARCMGGHTQTDDVNVDGKRYVVDTGFMAFNDRTYSNFVRMLELLEMPSRAPDMSLNERCGGTNLEYQGGTPLGLFGQRRNLFRPPCCRMLRDILGFRCEAPGLLKWDDDASPLYDYLRGNR